MEDGGGELAAGKRWAVLSPGVGCGYVQGREGRRKPG